MTMPAAVLFDLDGTLLDTAPDLINATNHVLQHEGRAAIAFEQLRPHVSAGAGVLLEMALGEAVDDARLQRLLDFYRANLAVATRLFDGMAAVLAHIEALGLPWGVVTNKPSWLTNPLMDALDLSPRAGCIISGDSTPEQKPHPLPLLEAARRIQVDPARCLYVGDDRRDIQAGQAAGMPTVAAAYGYIRPNDPPHTWGADGLIESPLELMTWLAQPTVTP